MVGLTTIGFDADDTLWQNEQFFRITEHRFADLVGEHTDAGDIPTRLLEAEKRNLAAYGYGIKGFTLSMIETALEATGGTAPGHVIGQILDWGREMLRHPVETLPHVRETLEALTGAYRLVLITKGDLFDQERKLAASGLGELFHAIEIVSEKSEGVYRRIFAKHGDGPERAMMVGNSVKSDIIPPIQAGSWGVLVPHALTWAAEHAEEPADAPRFRKIADLSALRPLIDDLS